MRLLGNLWSGMRSLWRRGKLKQEIDEELKFHLEQRTADNIEAGMPPEEAARESRKRFGNFQKAREECRDVCGASFGETTWKDIRFGARMLRKNPGFTAVAVLSLALGIGANTAVFSALNALLLRSLPVRDPQELRMVNWVGRNPELNSYTGMGMSITDAPGGRMGTSFPYPAYLQFRDRGTGFSELFAFFALKSVTAIARGEASSAGTMLVSGNFFSGYGASTLIGRPIASEDDQPGAAPIAVISYRWWERHCGFDPGILGESITLNQVSYTVIGILPRDFVGPMFGDPTDIYVPMSAQPHLVPSRPLDSPNRWWIQIMGRMAPGADPMQTQVSLALLFQQVLGESTTTMDDPSILIQDGSRGPLMLRQRLAMPILALECLVGLVLLIACANLAGLQLARGAARQHEMAVRCAIGASRWRLIRQSLTESVLLALLGGGLGWFVAAWIKRVLLGFLAFFPDGFHFDMQSDLNVLIFTLCISLVTALVFGALPAIRASRIDPLSGLKSPSGLRAPRLRLANLLVTAQVGLSVLLVAGAGLMLRTFVYLASVNPGFDPSNVLLFRLDPGQADYEGENLVDFYDQTRAAISAIPGVQAVAFSGFALASDSYSSESLLFPDRKQEAGEDRQTAVLSVSEDFFRTMSIPLLAGRDFAVTDTAIGSPVAVVNETFTRKFFGGINPIGQTFRLQDGSDRVFEIVGLCRDAKYNQLRAEIPPLAFFPQRQQPQPGVTFEVRSVLPPLSLVPAVRKTIASLDARLPLSAIKTQEQQLDQSLALDRLFASLGSAFAILAMLLACVGLFGLMAYNVERRTGEIGIRMALGATRGAIAGPILREALSLAALGVALGLIAALGVGQVIRNQLYGIQPTDPLSLVGAGIALVAVAIVAAWIPARRAVRVDPILALRPDR